MKTTQKIIATILCVALVVAGVQQTRGVLMLYVCVVGGTAIVGGATYYAVKACQPKYYCMTDAEGNRFYSNATKTEREVNDWTITGGPYDSAEEAAAGCVISTNGSPAAFTSITQVMAAQHSTITNGTGLAVGTAKVADGVFIPSQQITIWRSTDMKTWEVADRIMDDPTHFLWIDTNSVATASQMFYKVTSP